MAVQQIRLSAQRELTLARQMRTEAQKYQQETETKARSEAQQLILQARLATQKEIEELIRKASAEIQKVLADIRVIRITAQEELAAQKKFTDAARLCSLSLTLASRFCRAGRKKEEAISRQEIGQRPTCIFPIFPQDLSPVVQNSTRFYLSPPGSLTQSGLTLSIFRIWNESASYEASRQIFLKTLSQWLQ